MRRGARGRRWDMAQLFYADLWESIASAVPQRPALIRGARSLSWSEVDARADALAAQLLAAGLGQQAKVAAYLYNAPEYVETYFAAFKAGLVPFNTNYRYTGDELVYLFDNADAEAVVFHASFAPRLAAIRARLPRVKVWIAVSEPGMPRPDWALDYDALVSRRVGRTRAPWGRSADDVMLIYTGGTTGLPKGVMWRQGDLFTAIGGGANLLLGLGPLASVAEAGERARLLDQADASMPPPNTIAAAPLMHATGLLISFVTFTHGGCIVTLPSNQFRTEELFDEIARVRASSIVIVGMAFATPMLEALEAEPERWDLSSLRRIFSSGTIWNAENKQALLRYLPNVMLLDSWGSSEALGIGLSMSTAASNASTAKFMVSERTAVFNEAGKRVRPGSGERGMVALAGPIPLGYYKDPVKSAQAFRTFEGSRWSVPGDWAAVESDGSITLVGRGALVINTGGEKVFPEEVEEALKSYPGVRDAAVIGVPDARFGERVCAVVDVSEGIAVTLPMLADHVRSSLASYKVPRDLVLSKVARQPNGKLDYGAVREQVLTSLQRIRP